MELCDLPRTREGLAATFTLQQEVATLEAEAAAGDIQRTLGAVHMRLISWNDTCGCLADIAPQTWRCFGGRSPALTPIIWDEANSDSLWLQNRVLSFLR